ncbi:hypothetical protein RFI_08729 [Reticulomyxa filosa]|uniref:Uncharacterized protein n=1 Tax=Reticulomyxa filosa TaxID=46433 RepID=X6NSY1_RETFI|nr:hypothetical protein RFI_08729 [Reticulomyxa filosa]|eukprot:ETO28402.1 hypothetical protein RFI_08729 [Reticulomyxa filosa]
MTFIYFFSKIKICDIYFTFKIFKFTVTKLLKKTKWNKEEMKKMLQQHQRFPTVNKESTNTYKTQTKKKRVPTMESCLSYNPLYNLFCIKSFLASLNFNFIIYNLFYYPHSCNTLFFIQKFFVIHGICLSSFQIINLFNDAANEQEGHHQHGVGGQAQDQVQVQQVTTLQLNQQELPNVHEAPAQVQQSSPEVQEQLQSEPPQAPAHVQDQVLLQVHEESELKQDRVRVRLNCA